MEAKQDWLDRIYNNIDELKETPLFGRGTPFDFDLFSSLMAKELGIDGFTVRIKGQEMKEDLEVKPLVHSILLSPIDEPIFWTMSKVDRDLLTAKILTAKPRKKAFSSAVLQEGFYQFLLLEALGVTNEMEPLQQMTLQLGEEKRKIQEDAICIDVEIAFDGTTCWGRLILPESFRKKWVQHFAAFPYRYVPSSLSKSLQVDLGVQIGSVELELAVIQKLKKGDFILPDHLYNDSHARLTMGTTELFRLKRTMNQVEIEAYAFTTEETMEETDNLSHKLEKSDKEISALQNLPIHIHLEIGKLHMTLDELMNLSPGNLLDLPDHADKKIQLTVSGKKIGVAELVHLGETLGLKILEI